MLAGEHLLKVLEADAGVTDGGLAHPVKPVLTKVTLRGLGVAVGVRGGGVRGGGLKEADR
jgi:hypothetical protein